MSPLLLIPAAFVLGVILGIWRERSRNRNTADPWAARSFDILEDEREVPLTPIGNLLPTRLGSPVRLRFTYEDAEGEITERSVDMTDIEAREGVVLLAGHCQLRDAMRVFRADRIFDAHDDETGEVIRDVPNYLLRRRSAAS